MPAAAVAGVAAIGGSLIQASSARSAARSQASALQRSRRSVQQAAEDARREILDRLDPALEEYSRGIGQAQDQIASGTADVMQILQQSTGRADQLLQNIGVDAQRAILGSAAQTAGIPMSRFDQQYNQIQAQPPMAQQAMMSALTQGIGQSMASKTGMPVEQATATIAQSSGQPELAAQVTGRGATSLVGPRSFERQQQPQTGFAGAQGQLQRGETQGIQALSAGIGQARTDIGTGLDQSLGQLAETRQAGLERYQPYSEAGRGAVQQEAALSGALGPEAQQQAIDAFIESPGQKFLRERQEKALLRSQAATGGLGGGNVLTALQEQAMGIASTQQQQYLENLRSLAGRGQQAAGAEAGLIGQTGMMGAQMTQQAGQQLAQLAQQLGVSSADLIRMSSSDMAQLAERTGLNLSQLQQTIGAARVGAQTDLGQGLASAAAGMTSDIASMTEREAINRLQTEQQTSTQLANLATGAGTQTAELQAAQGSALASGQMLQGQALTQGLQGLGAAATYGMQNQPTQSTLATPTYTSPQSTVSNVNDMSHLYP